MLLFSGFREDLFAYVCELLQTFLNLYGNMPDRIRRCDIKTNAFFFLD